MPKPHLITIRFIENRKLANLDTYTCFVDFKKAFDSLPRELLWRKLASIGIRGELLKSLKALYTNLYSSIKVNGRLSPAFKVGCGVKQGCTLSPILFNIFINDLIEYLNEAVKRIEIKNTKKTLLFADELVLTVLIRNFFTMSNTCSSRAFKGTHEYSHRISLISTQYKHIEV